MDTWRGHFPITHFVLSALLNKRNGADAADFSRAEAVLLAACQFWAAAATRQLPEYLGANPVPKLLVAFEAFSEIGAVRVASALRVAVGTYPETGALRGQTLDLEARLLDTEDAVDRLIAQFASIHLADDAGPALRRFSSR
ncbi:MAG TPA: hypothetical protein VK793_05085 [Steroidobacteraceae bacterium]|jgi:hypothetical protein|nr:hypothetical protein [Steroidobacteraceae bacterium]